MNLPKCIPTASDEFPLPEDFPTASEEKFPLLSDSYEAPQDDATIGSASEGSAKKKGRTVAVTTEDMQKRRNNTFGGNEATKKTKKNQLKKQYGNFKAEGSETLEQTFNRLHAIVSHLEFMDIEIEQDDLNQKFLTSLALEWLMYMIVWRNRSDLDTISLDDVYNHLKVKNGEVNNASIPTASTQVSPASANVAAANSKRRLGKRFPFKVLMWLALISQRWSALTATRWATLLGSAGLPGSKTGVEEKTSNRVLSDSFVSENGESSESIMSKPMIKFVKAADSPTVIKTNKDETVRKPFVKYAEMYRKVLKSANAYFPLLDQPVPTVSISIMARLAFCDYLNMIAILEKYEHNHDFHQIVDFVEASHIRYALTINPTIYVSYIRQFWSTARIETTDERTKILATINGTPRTISESSIRINLKLRDEAGISSLPDAELFENL
nr:hypothetical protein [Tanacetum cinerariifolium]